MAVRACGSFSVGAWLRPATSVNRRPSDKAYILRTQPGARISEASPRSSSMGVAAIPANGG